MSQAGAASGRGEGWRPAKPAQQHLCFQKLARLGRSFPHSSNCTQFLEAFCVVSHIATKLFPSKAAKAMQQRALSISKKYKGACLSLARDGPDIVDIAACLWQNIALPSLLYGCETVPFSASTIDEISRHQSSIGKFSLGLPYCSPNISAEVILGMKPFKQLLYASQLKFYARLSTQDNSRWSKDALLDHVLGGWDSPYIKYLGAIKDEVGMRKWPVNAKHVDVVLNHHFISKSNSEIERLSTPALEPLAKRARMDHVNESEESQVN